MLNKLKKLFHIHKYSKIGTFSISITDSLISVNRKQRRTKACKNKGKEINIKIYVCPICNKFKAKVDNGKD